MSMRTVLAATLLFAASVSTSHADIIITANGAPISNNSQALGSGGSYISASMPSFVLTNPYVASSSANGQATQPQTTGVNTTTGSTGNQVLVTVDVTNTSLTTPFLVQMLATSSLDWVAAVGAPDGSGSLMGQAETQLSSVDLGLNELASLPMALAVTDNVTGLGPVAFDVIPLSFVVQPGATISLLLRSEVQGTAVATSDQQEVTSSFNINASLTLELVATQAVPEPTSVAVWGLGTLALVGLRRWRQGRTRAKG